VLSSVNVCEGGSDRERKSKCNQIPTIINGRNEALQMNVPGKYVKGSSNGKIVKMLKDHKVLIYGDSHSQGLSSSLKDKLSDTFDVSSYTKPNCNIQSLLSNENQEIVNLTNKDVFVFIGGSDNVNDDTPAREQWHISQFINWNSHTNIILLTIPYHYDQTVNENINDKIIEVNRKIGKCTRFNKYVMILETPQDRGYYTRHGLHLNGRGKEIICRQLASVIDRLFQPIEVIPITLDWNSNQVMSLELEATPVNSDLDNTWSKDDIEDECEVEESKVCRVSNRQKKVPVDRTDDFLWQI
jgi:23S rRNA pseudoU1915 N3-methylase RlmH